MREKLRSWKYYWTQRGIVPRWQLVLVYVLIAGSGTFAFAQNSNAINQIQQNRIELCDQANQRHDNVLKTLDREIKTLPPGKRAQAEAQKASTVRLLNAIVPKRDCQAQLTK